MFSRSDALVQWAAKQFSQAWCILYEQIHPGDPFGTVMQKHFQQLNSQLRSLARYPDCEAQRARFLQRVGLGLGAPVRISGGSQRRERVVAEVGRGRQLGFHQATVACS